MKKILMILGILLVTSTFAGAEADIEEIDVSNQYSPNYDIRIKVVWVGGDDIAKTAGQTEWLRVRHSKFGHNGVDRVTAVALTALTGNKSCWLNYSGNDLTAIKLKNTRN